jgi:small-conductance mechanosensitive channel
LTPQHFQRALPYFEAIAALIAVAWTVRLIGLRYLRQWEQQSTSRFAVGLVKLTESVTIPLTMLGITNIAINFLPIPATILHIANRVLWITILSIFLYCCGRILHLAMDGWLTHRQVTVTLREPLHFVSNIVFAGLALMIVLDNLGVSLTAVWTTLGVGSVAVALALQDTLSNFFAGFYVHLDRPVHVDDYIKLDNGAEGYVSQLGWRSARIRTLGGNIIVVPNNKLSSAIVTNFSLPDPSMSITISINVSYESDPVQVERVLTDEASRAVGSVQGLVATDPPSVSFIPGFGDWALQFGVNCKVATFVDQYPVQHELRKRLFARLQKEGIRIPFPQRDIHLRIEEAEEIQLSPQWKTKAS